MVSEGRRLVTLLYAILCTLKTNEAGGAAVELKTKDLVFKCEILFEIPQTFDRSLIHSYTE